MSALGEGNSGGGDSKRSTVVDIISKALKFFGMRKPGDNGNYNDPEDPDRLRIINERVPKGDRQAIFRRLTGIDSARAHEQNKQYLNRPAPNQGIYKHVVDEEKAARKEYVIFSRLINGCLGLQIIVAAALTALGAGNGPHAVVTIFGAINTVIAGFLTYLKGSGLPHRTKFFQNQWSQLRDFIEQRERDFGCQDCDLDVYAQVKIVEDMYKEVKAEIEANTPDGYMSMTRPKDKTPVSVRLSEKSTQTSTTTEGLWRDDERMYDKREYEG